MKKILSLLIVLTMVFSAVTVMAEDINISLVNRPIFVNGEQRTSQDSKMVYSSTDTTYLGLRAVFENILGFKVDYDSKNDKIYVNTRNIEFLDTTSNNVYKVINPLFNTLTKSLANENYNKGIEFLYNHIISNKDNLKLDNVGSKEVLKFLNMAPELEKCNLMFGYSKAWRDYYSAYNTLADDLKKADYNSFVYNYVKVFDPTSKALDEFKKTDALTEIYIAFEPILNKQANEDLKDEIASFNETAEIYVDKSSIAGKKVTEKLNEVNLAINFDNSLTEETLNAFENAVNEYIKTLVRTDTNSMILTLKDCKFDDKSRALLYAYNLYKQNDANWDKLYSGRINWKEDKDVKYAIENYIKTLVAVTPEALTETLNSITAEDRQEALMYAYNLHFSPNTIPSDGSGNMDTKWDDLYTAYKAYTEKAVNFNTLRDVFCEFISYGNVYSIVQKDVWNNGFWFLREYNANPEDKTLTAEYKKTFNKNDATACDHTVVVEYLQNKVTPDIKLLDKLYENHPTLKDSWCTFFTEYIRLDGILNSDFSAENFEDIKTYKDDLLTALKPLCQ